MGKKVGPYNLELKIGKGAYGIVYKGRERISGKVFAVKSVDSKVLSRELRKHLESEIKTMKRVHSDYVVKLYDLMMTTKNVYLVMEFCEGGDLDKAIRKNGPVPERLAKKWISQLLSAFSALQSCHIVHRDLKLANILLTSSDIEQADLKLADFGFAKVLAENALTQTQLGTPRFMAPELYNKEAYSYNVDVWALGVLSYEIMTGQPLFNCMTYEDLRYLQSQPIEFPPEINLSQSAKDLVQVMLTFNASERPSFDDLMEHPFLKPEVCNLTASCILPISEGPLFREEQEVTYAIDEETIKTPSVELSESSNQALLEIERQAAGAEKYAEKAKKYAEIAEFMIAYAYYRKYTNTKAEQLAKLQKFIEKDQSLIELNPTLDVLLNEIEQSIVEGNQVLASLPSMMPQKISLDESWVVFENEAEFKLDENALVSEVERVLGSSTLCDQELTDGILLAEELLQMAIEENPDNLRASTLHTEIKERIRQLLA